MTKRPSLFDRGGDLSPEDPQVYLAMAMSQIVEPEDRKQLERRVDVIVQALLDLINPQGSPWRVRIHSPFEWSAPWRDDLTAIDIYRANSTKLFEDTDALIVVGFMGASVGAGQELTWAAAQQLPILYTVESGEIVSRQVLGMATEHDLEVLEHETDDELREGVRRWMITRQHMIVDNPRRRRSRETLHEPFRQRLATAWDNLNPTDREHVIAVTRLAEGRIARLLTSAHALSTASLAEARALAAALGIHPPDEVAGRSLPDLRSDQLAALANAAGELEWDATTVLDLHLAARLELAKGGVRRLSLSNIEDWQQFARTRRDR